MYGKKQYDDTNRGALFARQKRTTNSPDMGGDFTIGGDVLDYVKRCIERGVEVKLEISAWRKMSRGNTPFTSIQVDIPWQVKKGQDPNSQSMRGYGNQQGSYGNRGGYDQRPLDNRNVAPFPTRQMGSRDDRFPDQRGDYDNRTSGGGYVGGQSTDKPGWER